MSLIIVSSLRLKLSITMRYEKNHFFKKDYESIMLLKKATENIT